MSCIEPLQHLLSEKHNELTTYKAVINRICSSAINTITVFFKLKPEKFLLGYNNSMSKFKKKLT